MALDLESVDSRSSSPQEHTGRPISSHPLKFSIEKILSPDFGRRDNSQHAKDIPHNENTTASIGSSDTESKAGFPPSKDAGKVFFPAWLFCTRYSDRPSSVVHDKKFGGSSRPCCVLWEPC
ncbi:uncharacterized protein CDAR_496901 [Caerostris darwini]|uniref:Engrailed n=1 Tax=Caerostris darwini TaxID=1538125 RepID=A0AAV4U596_9ARAC|nr:uncharacterized protein CDAR_496901 [Caerostris darwini]